MDRALALPHPSTLRLQTGYDVAIAVLGAILTLILLFRCPRYLWSRLPYSALIILFVFYGLFGWVLATYNSFAPIWLSMVILSAAIALIVSIELGMMGLRSLILAGLATIISVFAPQPAGHISRLVAIALATLTTWLWAVGSARYRMESAGIDRPYILWTLIAVSWVALWFGWVIDTFAMPQTGRWLVENILTPSFLN